MDQQIAVLSCGEVLQSLNTSNVENAEGNISGGRAYTTGLDIDWQDGPIGWPPDPSKINGTFPTVVIQAVIERLKAYQETSLKTRETALAITSLEEAFNWLDQRVRQRVQRDVQGSYQP